MSVACRMEAAGAAAASNVGRTRVSLSTRVDGRTVTGERVRGWALVCALEVAGEVWLAVCDISVQAQFMHERTSRRRSRCPQYMLRFVRRADVVRLYRAGPHTKSLSAWATLTRDVLEPAFAKHTGRTLEGVKFIFWV